jgi:Uma2 family endonuclease
MSTISRPALSKDDRVELHTGDKMTREEFHRVYEMMPEHVKAELIGGIVYVASPLSRGHGMNHLPLGSLFFAYEGATPGVESGDNTTVLLGDESEPQPDLYLRIIPECGGQSRTSKDDYVDGAPELIAEIAHSSRSIDLHAKRDDYTRYGVQEYLVLSVRERQLRHFDLRARQEIPPEPDGILRLQTFPGLWVDAQALLVKDHARLMATLQRGLASPEYAAFVKRLAAAHAGGGAAQS